MADVLVSVSKNSSGTPDFLPPLENLQTDLVSYIDSPSPTPFNLTAVSRATTTKPKGSTQGKDANGSNDKAPSSKDPQGQAQGDRRGGAPSSTSAPASVSSVVSSTPELRGRLQGDSLLYSSRPIELTEKDCVAYEVTAVKHLFGKHLLVQYNITNTIKEHLLKDLTVDAGINSDDAAAGLFKVELAIPAPSCAHGETVQVYALIKRPFFSNEDVMGEYLQENESKLPTVSLWNNLHFKMHNVDQQTGEADSGVADEYPLDELEFSVADYVRPANPLFDLSSMSFQEAWSEAQSQHESVNTFAWSTVHSLQEGVSEIIRFLGMKPVENSEKFPPGSTKHILLLTGTFMEGGNSAGIPLLAEVRMRLAGPNAGGVQMKLSVRSPNEAVSGVIANAIFQ